VDPTPKKKEEKPLVRRGGKEVALYRNELLDKGW